MRPQGTAEELERRRLRAVSLLQEGYGPTEVARMVGADRRSVQRWARRYEAGGDASLKAKPHPGKPPKLTGEQQQQLVEALLKGPKAHGFSTDLWNCPRVGRLIRKLFGVHYCDSGVWRVLASLGWSCQKPEGRAIERDEAAIREWIQKDWPRIKKLPAA